jgi:glycerol-3-phosphate acyltransferase PlsY
MDSYLVGLSCAVGHAFPCYYRFKGGKGVAVTAAIVLVMEPMVFLLLLVIFAVIVAATKYVSLGSVCVAMLYPVMLHGTFAFLFESAMDGMIALSTIVLACLIVWCHRENLRRIGERTENKLSFGKKKND